MFEETYKSVTICLKLDIIGIRYRTRLNKSPSRIYALEDTLHSLDKIVGKRYTIGTCIDEKREKKEIHRIPSPCRFDLNIPRAS